MPSQMFVARAVVFARYSDVLLFDSLEKQSRAIEVGMAKPVIFTVSAVCYAEANVWSGHCDELPAVADAPTLDELLHKISQMALDVAPDNYPGIDPDSIYIHVTALREASPAAA